MSKRKHDNENDDMTAKKPKPKDNRLIYHSVATLKNLAAAKIAIALWLHQNIRNIRPSLGFDWQSSISEYAMVQEIHDTSGENKLIFGDCVLAEVRKSIETLNNMYTFKKITEEVSKYLVVVKEELEDWANYQFRRIFFDRDRKEVLKYLDEVAWRPNALIDYRASAINMLNSPKITEMEKFRIGCTYCLKEELLNVSPLLFTNKYREPVFFENHPLICYWNCYVTKEWHRISFENYNSVESRMITMKEVDNECALKYLFRKDKANKAISLIRHYGMKYQIFALSLLNEAQQRQVFEQIAPLIITNFATPPCYSTHALNTWYHVKNFVTGDQFIQIISELLDLWINENEINSLDLSEIIAKVWRTAPDNLKRYGVEYIESTQIIADVLNRPLAHLLNGSNFLLAMLPDLDDDTKKHVIRSDGCFYMFEKVIDSGLEVRLIHDFISVCLPDENEALEFKKRVTKMRLFKHRCMHQSTSPMSVKATNKFVAEFLPDSNAVDSYIEELFTSHFGITHFVKILEYADIDFSYLRTQIEKALSQNDKVNSFITKFILSDDVIEKFRDWILGGCLNDVKNCLEQFCCDEFLTERVKTSIFRPYRGENIIEVFSELKSEKSEEFLLWCLNGESNVLKLKNTLPFDRIFQSMLQESVFAVYDRKNDRNCELRYPCDFSGLDGFLQWYFESKEAVKKFKIDQINEYQQIDILHRHQFGIWEREKGAVKCIFHWFLDNDRDEVEKFEDSNEFCQFDIQF